MTGIVTRPFAPGDAQAIADLIVPIQRDEFAIPITYADQPDLHDIAGFYRRGAGEFWIACAGARLVGTVALVDIGAGVGALRKMFVAADYRGAAHGTARRLLTTLLDHARAQRLRQIYLGTTDKFLAAHRFYEKHGFAVVDPDALPPDFPRMAVDTRFYRLDL